MEKNIALSKAVSILGGVVKAASTLGLSGYQVIQQWAKARVPADYCPSIERVTNGAVTCEELRPDVDWGYLRGTKRAA